MSSFPALSSGAVTQLPYTEIEQFYVTQDFLDCGKASTHSWNPSGLTLPRYLVTYANITTAEVATLESFWNSQGGSLATFSFTDDAGVTHTKCAFDQAAFLVQYLGPNQYALELKIVVKP